jgi:hypothetical protein
MKRKARGFSFMKLVLYVRTSLARLPVKAMEPYVRSGTHREHCGCRPLAELPHRVASPRTHALSVCFRVVASKRIWLSSEGFRLEIPLFLMKAIPARSASEDIGFQNKTTNIGLK